MGKEICNGIDLKTAIDGFKKIWISKKLVCFNGNQTLTAKAIGIQRTYLSRLIKELGINWHESQIYKIKKEFIKKNIAKHGTIYILKIQGVFKIGFTCYFEKRMQTYKTHNPNFELILRFDGSIQDETKLQNEYEHKWLFNEWFALDDNDIENIKRNIIKT